MQERRLSAFLWLLAVAAAAGPAPAQSQKRLQRVEIRPKAGPLSGQQFYTNSHALIVGVSRYQHLNRDNWLRYAHKDALALRDVLIRSYGFPAENVTVLLDEQATRANIEAALYALAGNAVEPEDRLLIYFSGHGQTVKLTSGGEMGFLIPYDARVDLSKPDDRGAYLATCIRMDTLWGNLEASSAKHSLILVDSCYGGLLARSRKLEPNPSPAVISGLLARPARQVLTAGSRDEEAWESPNLGHGAFTSKLLEELKARARTPNQMFLASELAAALKRSVGELTGGKQTPQFGNYGGTEGEFLFLSTPPKAVAQLPQPQRPAPPTVSPAPEPARPELPERSPEPAPVGVRRLDVANLHPALRLSPEEVARALALGQEEARRGKTLENLLDRYKRKPRWVRGKGGTVHESEIRCFGIEGNAWTIGAFRAATLYEPVNVPDEVRTRGHVVSELRFEVRLTSIPKSSQSRRASSSQFAAALASLADSKKKGENKAAPAIKETVVIPGDAADVRVVKFVLSDDKGRAFPGVVEASEDASATVRIPLVRPARDGEDGAASETNADGEEVPAGHVLFFENHKVHRMGYTVAFSLFDEHGQARVRPDAKQLILHIITENGEQVVSYDLRKPGRG